MKGRAGDPSPLIAEAEGRELVRLARAAGYAGIYIDRFGYEDNAASLEQGLTTAVGEAPLVSPNGRLSFFELPG
jgi:phosphoglycerol transferase